MKKTLSLIRSMRFGIALMLAIAVFSIVGTVIPQGRAAEWYVQTYPQYHSLILRLKLNDVYYSWYFQLLLVLLCLNLTLCSIVCIRRVSNAGKRERDALLNAPQRFPLNAGARELLVGELRGLHCRDEGTDGSLIFSKNGFGRCGSFLTHLSILLTLVFGALALYLPQSVNQSCFPGESLTMEDGTIISVESFRIEDETGKLDYTSEIRVVLPDGRDSGMQEIRVNHPLSFDKWKIYQQSYGVAGCVTVENVENGGEESFRLTREGFLSLDGVNGIWYEAVYPDLIRDENGDKKLVTTSSGSYPNPVYQIQADNNGNIAPLLVFPGEELQIGNLKFRFEDPVAYPGLRMKNTPSIVNALLCGAFLLMIAGLYISFFVLPVLVRVDSDGCAVGGAKPEYMNLIVKRILQEETE